MIESVVEGVEPTVEEARCLISAIKGKGLKGKGGLLTSGKGVSIQGEQAQ